MTEMLAATNAAGNHFMETDRSMGVDLRVLQSGHHSFSKHLLSKPDRR